MDVGIISIVSINSIYKQPQNLQYNYFRVFVHMYRPYFSPPKNQTAFASQQKFPEDIECIIRSKEPNRGSLYISNVEAAQNPVTLQKLMIQAVLGCAKDYKISHPSTILKHYKYVPTQDRQTFDLTPYFDECIDFIRQTLKQTNLLVHCIAGVSRSVSMVLAYLIAQKDMTYEEAYDLVKARRRIIHPNSGFINQLKKFHHTVKSKKKENANKTVQISDKAHNFVDGKGIDYQTPKKTLDQAQTPRWTRPSSTGYQKHQVMTQNYQLRHQTSHRKDAKETLPNAQTINYKYQAKGDHVYQYRKGYFDEMNEQLNKKIKAIRQKYDKQRQQLLNTNSARQDKHLKLKDNSDNYNYRIERDRGHSVTQLKKHLYSPHIYDWHHNYAYQKPGNYNLDNKSYAYQLNRHRPLYY